jgi:hypothetical protein
MVGVIAGKYRFHLELLPVIKEKPNFEFIGTLVAASESKAVPTLMFAAKCLQDNRLVVVTVAALMCENVNVHLFGFLFEKRRVKAPAPL